MKIFLFLVVIASTEKWSDNPNVSNSVLKLIKELKKSSTGKTLIKKANFMASIYEGKLLDLIDGANSSFCELSLVRRFSNEKTFYSKRAKIFLNRDLSIPLAVLDLAHEMTHFIDRPFINPYDAKFSLERFINNIVSAPGGEVDAFINECKVMRELYPKRFLKNYRCQSILVDNKLSMEKAKELFFQIGDHYQNFENLLHRYQLDIKKFPLVTSESPLFLSAFHDVPYPLAAIYEYQLVLEKSCQNERAKNRPCLHLL